MTESLKDQVVVGISTESTPASPQRVVRASDVTPGQMYKSRDKRRGSTILITEVTNAMGTDYDLAKGISTDASTRRQRTVVIRVSRLLKKYVRVI